MNEAFETAFYQLDKDRDGVVTLRDLERYVRDHNLKDKFIQKWLTLFGDEKNIIYYDKFCETLGIVPAPEKFVNKTYRLDMTEETRESVENVIKEYREKDEQFSNETLRAICDSLSEIHGDKWNVKINPTKDDLNVNYATDGLIYYSYDLTERPKVLVYRGLEEPIKTCPGIVYRKDMTDETEESLYNIISTAKPNTEGFNPKNIEVITRSIKDVHGDEWGMVINPTVEELNVPYKNDGILYCSLNETEEPKVLVWRKSVEVVEEKNDIIYESIMSEGVKAGVLESVHRHYDSSSDKMPQTEKIVKELNEKYGLTWNVLINPSEKQLKVDYDFDGKIYFAPNSNENVKVLVWRKDKEKTRGKMCFCCF